MDDRETSFHREFFKSLPDSRVKGWWEVAAVVVTWLIAFYRAFEKGASLDSVLWFVCAGIVTTAIAYFHGYAMWDHEHKRRRDAERSLGVMTATQPCPILRLVRQGTDVLVEVTNRGGQGTFWSEIVINGLLAATVPSHLLAMWTQQMTASPRATLVNGERSRIIVAERLELNHGAWQFCFRCFGPEGNAIAVRSYYTVIIGTDPPSPPLRFTITLKLFATPSAINGIIQKVIHIIGDDVLEEDATVMP